MSKFHFRKSILLLILLILIFLSGQIEIERVSAITPTPSPAPSLPPSVHIFAPLNYETIASTSATIKYVESGDLSQVDHVHLQLDSQPEIRDLDNDGVYVFNNLQHGWHRIFVYLARVDHTRFSNPESNDYVTFDINTTPIGVNLPDLIVTQMRIELETRSGCYNYPTVLGLSAYIKNNGLTDAGPFVVEANSERKSVDGLAAGQTVFLWGFTGNFNYLNSVTAIVDVTDLVTESNENNNQLTAFVPIPTLPPITCTPTPAITNISSCLRKSQGDANCDGLIDLIDFEVWRREFSGSAATTNADYNNDSLINLIDFEVWRRTFTGSAPTPTLTSIPTKTPTASPHYTPTLSPTLGASPSPTPTSSVQAKPNIIFIITDDQNVDSLPVMRKLMSYPEGSWVKFNNAYVNDSICCPARATILSGQYSHHTGVTGNSKGDLFNDANALPVWLDNAGYHTGLIGKYLNGYPWNKGTGYVPPGWDYFITAADNADGRTNLAVNFINSSTSPFFLYLAYNDPHHSASPMTRYINADVYIPPDPPNFNEADVSDKPAWIRSLNPLSQTTIDTWRNERVASQRALLAVDDGIQLVVDALKAKAQLENTMIIFMSDHGFSWGSHRYILKHCFYEECSLMPLVIRLPGLSGNREENRLVSNVDLASTIAEYAGVTPGLSQDGKSFLSVLSNTATVWNEDVLLEVAGSSNRSFYGIAVPGWKYAEYATGDKELYDLTADPYELQNQANKPDYQIKQSQLAQRLRILKGF